MLRTSPIVSIYLVNHNYEKYLQQAIDSVLKQTFQDFELIIIDNDSSDNSREIIEPFAVHKKIKVILQDNIGLNATNNVAINMAKGRYIMRLDADDYLDEHALEIMVGKLEREKNIDLIFPDYYLVDESGNIIELMRRHDFSEVKLLDQPAHGACTLVRRECLIALDGYDELYHCQDGWDLWVRFIQKHGVTNVNLPLFYYRQHANSLSGNEERILSTRAKILKKNANNSRGPTNCIAVIPIRGEKIDSFSYALKKLGGKALMDWTLDEALAAEHISRVVVTSPDEGVCNHVKGKYGEKVDVFERDWKLALPNMSLDATLTTLFDKIPEEWRSFDAIALLFIECPFRTARYIDMAIDAMEIFQTNRVIGIRKERSTFYRHSGEGVEPLKVSKLLRQEKDELFQEAGGIYVVRRGTLYRDIEVDKKIGHVDLDEISALHVSSDWTWKIAQSHASSLKEQNSG